MNKMTSLDIYTINIQTFSTIILGYLSDFSSCQVFYTLLDPYLLLVFVTFGFSHGNSRLGCGIDIGHRTMK